MEVGNIGIIFGDLGLCCDNEEENGHYMTLLYNNLGLCRV